MATGEVLDSGSKTHLSPTAAELDEMFKTRYSAEDEEYQAYVNAPAIPPPVVQDWYSRPRRHYDYTRGQNRGNRGGQRWNQGHNYRDNWGQRGQGNYGGRGHYGNDRGYYGGGYYGGRGHFEGRGHYGNQGYRDRSYDRQDRQGYREPYDRQQRRGGRPLYAGMRPDEY